MKFETEGKGKMLQRSVRLFVFSLFFAIFGCGISEQPGDKDLVSENSSFVLSDTVLRQRTDSIKAHAALRGITNPLVIAGTANHETGLSQCYNEFGSGGCNNVAPSVDCPSSTGGVLGGGGDTGGCSAMGGGIGMFQLDKGTYSDTRAFYGDSILTVDGNIEAGVNFFIDRLGFHCIYTPTFQDETGVINWLNAAKFGATEYDKLLTGLAACYNGCLPSWTTGCGPGQQYGHDYMKTQYDNAIHALYNKFGDAYWYDNASSNCSSPITFSGSGSNGQNGANCLATYDYPVVAGQTYTISTCDNYSGDTYLKTMGACTCNPSGNDDACGGLGSQCTCTATSTGTATICASTFSTASASWNYQVTCGAPSQPPTCQNSGPFSGSGSNGQSGTNCLAIYSFPVIEGNMYRISTCDSFSGDTYLKTNGACVCYPNRVNDDFCGLGSECDCYATSTGMGTICASTSGSASAAWNYKVTCLPN